MAPLRQPGLRKPAVPSRESEGHSARLRAHRDLTAAGRGPRGGRAPPAVTPGWGAGRGREEVGMRGEAERSGPPSVGQPGGAGRGAALVGRYLSARLRSDSARLEEGAAPVCVGRGGECCGRPGALLSVPKPAAAGGCRRRLRHRQPRRPCGWREERGGEGSLCGHSRTLGHAACLRSSHSPPAQPQVCAGAVWEAGRPAGPPRSARAVGCSRAYLRAVRKALLRALLARSAEKRL